MGENKINKYDVFASDIKKRIAFIIKLVQNQNGNTMQGALTSKSDSMGGIFDRFINSFTESLIFEKEIIPNLSSNEKVEIINDFYFYSTNKKLAGIAPDIFGLIVGDKKIPFVKFDNKWEPVKGKPQIEVKTFKEKDQMISLRNQNYDDKYLVMVDLNLRIDYLVPFFDQSILTNDLIDSMKMDDDIFIIKDSKNLVKNINYIDYSNDKIGEISLIAITTGTEFMQQSNLCKGNISPYRMKSIKQRRIKIKNEEIYKLKDFCNASPRIPSLYEYNAAWYQKMQINKDEYLDINKHLCLDFSAQNIDHIQIINFKRNGVVLKATANGCSFNETQLKKDEQYTVDFELLDRESNNKEEHFMQKECAVHLNNLKDEIITKFNEIISEINR